jgi:hypothetical protein
MKLVCSQASSCNEVNCEHIKEHDRPYRCSHYCDRTKTILTCKEVKG